MRAAALGLGVNVALGIAKLVGGILGDSFALIADSVNSFADVVASTVVLAALWYAQQPADEAHPYGHTRAEAVAGSNVALLMILSALVIAWQAVWRLPAGGDPPPAGWTLWLAAANVVIKETLFRYKLGVARRSRSRALVANAWDHRSDALASLAVLVGLAVIRFGGPGFAWADEAAALVVAGAIVWAGVALFHTSANELLDRQADPELVARVERTARSVPGVEEVETLRLRKSGLEYFGDLHIEVESGLSVADGHRLGHVVKDRLLREYPRLRDVLVHVEPWRGEDGPNAG